MAAKRTRTYAKLLNSLWSSDFTQLSVEGQRLYMLLLSQPETNAAGVVPLMERRWARLANGSNLATITAALDELEAARYVFRDEDTEELFIRSFIVNDEGYRTPNILVNIKQAIEQIHSFKLRAIARETLAKVLGQRSDDGRAEPLGEPLSEPLGEGLPEGIPHPSITTTTTTGPDRDESEPLADVLPIDHSEPAIAGKRRGDPFVTALVEACGWEWRTMTKSEQGAAMNAGKTLRGVGADPDEAVARAEVYRRKFRDATMTPSALAKHWSQLVPPKRPQATVIGGARMSQGAMARW